MVKPEEVKWGEYDSFEGPVYYGKKKYSLPDVYTENDEVLLVITATEGGTYDAYNGYDSCISSAGLIQWCERAPFFLVSKMLGAVAERDRGLLQPIDSLASELGGSFKKNGRGEWRFFLGPNEVTATDQQQRLFLHSATGKKGSFNPNQVYAAKRWAAAVCSTLGAEEALRPQREFTAARVFGFATSSARQVIDASRSSDGPVAKAFRAAFLSFAANNPQRASDALAEVIRRHGCRFDKDWLIQVLKGLTFLPNVAIYPHRYEKIRPVLEKLYSLDLPDYSKELKDWKDINGFGAIAPTSKGIQAALIALGYDLGPSGADGVFGKCSKAALKAFEVKSGVPAAHQDGVPDEYTYPLLLQSLEEKKITVNLRA